MQHPHRSTATPPSQSSSITSRMADLQLQSMAEVTAGTDVPAGSSSSKSRHGQRPYVWYDGLLDAPSVSTMGHNYTPPRYHRVADGPSQTQTVAYGQSQSRDLVSSRVDSSNDAASRLVVASTISDVKLLHPTESTRPLDHHNLSAPAPQSTNLQDADLDRLRGLSGPLSGDGLPDNHSPLLPLLSVKPNSTVFDGPYGSWTTRDPQFLSRMQSSRPTSAPSSTTLRTGSHDSSAAGTPTSSSSSVHHHQVDSTSHSPSMVPVSAVHRSQGGGLGPAIPLSLFKLTESDRIFLSNSHSFNAIPVRRCQPPPHIVDPMPHLPYVLVRVVKPMQVGQHVTLMRDPMSFVPLEIQCQCKQFVCQYQAFCGCDDVDCPWPDELHDPSFVPRFSQSSQKSRVTYEEDHMDQ